MFLKVTWEPSLSAAWPCDTPESGGAGNLLDVRGTFILSHRTPGYVTPQGRCVRLHPYSAWIPGPSLVGHYDGDLPFPRVEILTWMLN
jgi:hypothetical protein